MILCNSELKSQHISDVDSLISIIEATGPNEDISEYSDLIVHLLYNLEFNEAKKLSDKLLVISAKIKNPELRVSILIHSYRFYNFEKKIKNLNEAQVIAKANSNDDWLAATYTFKSIVFRDNYYADSAMTYALLAKDILSKSGDTSSYISIIQLIADMHYYAQEFEEAEKLYIEVQSKEPAHFKRFNYRIVQNNLGLIRIKQKRYDEAEQYFLNSIRHFSEIPATYTDSSGLPYIYRKLMEVNLLKGDFNSAEFYCINGIQLANYYVQRIELPGFYTGRGVIFLQKNQLDSALYYLRLAEETEKEFPDLKYKIDLYTALSDLFQKRGDFKQESHYLRLLNSASTTADSLFNRAKLLHLYAQANYNSALKEIENFKSQRLLHFTITFIILAFLGVFVIYYLRLKKSYKLLVERSLQIALSKPDDPFPMFSDEDATPLKIIKLNEFHSEEIEKKAKEIDEETLNRIIKELDLVFKNEKPFLKPGLTANSLAEMLNTNRTYLQKAISKKYNLNFLDFINGYRIKEAINILNSSEAKNFSVEGIAIKAGFSNRVTFSKIFKEATGVSPALFMKNIEHPRNSNVESL